MNTLYLSALTALLLSACATTEPVPSARKLTPSLMSKLGTSDAVIEQNEEGIRASWTSAGAGQPGYTDYSYLAPPGTSPMAAGIGGAIGQAIAVAIVDAAPSARAKRSVATINMGMDKALLDKALIQKFKSARSAGDLKIGTVNKVVFERKAPEPMNQIKIIPSYTLAEDASAVRVMAKVSYESDEIEYQTPYSFEGKPPKSETAGPLYRNSFTYHSDKFNAPELTESVRLELVDAIQTQYEEDVASIGADKNPEKARKKLIKARDKALEQAQDDKLSKTETATLLISQWRGSGSPALREAINDGQDFIVEMLLMDMNDSTVPQFEPKNPEKPKSSFWTSQPIHLGPIGSNESTVVDTKGDGRKVERIDSGINAGAYHSYPENGFATYGNTYKVAE